MMALELLDTKWAEAIQPDPAQPRPASRAGRMALDRLEASTLRRRRTWCDHPAHSGDPQLTRCAPYPGAMAIVSRSFDEPDELVTQPLVTMQVVVLGEVYIARVVHQPGWSWSEHVELVAGTATCQHHHQGVALAGQVEIEMEGGARRIVCAGEAFDIPPGHLSRVVGDEPYVTIEFAGVRGWAKPPEAGERVVATLLVTDIVGSTDVAVRLGDAAWKEVLAGHGDRVRRELDRFRGLEVTTTGDGFLPLRRCGPRCPLRRRDSRPRQGRRAADPRRRPLGRGRARGRQYPRRRRPRSHPYRGPRATRGGAHLRSCCRPP